MIIPFGGALRHRHGTRLRRSAAVAHNTLKRFMRWFCVDVLRWCAAVTPNTLILLVRRSCGGAAVVCPYTTYIGHALAGSDWACPQRFQLRAKGLSPPWNKSPSA